MPCAFWLIATLPPPWSWPQAHRLSISLGYFPGTLPYQSRKSSRRNARCPFEMPPHTPSAIKHICILHLAKIIYYTSNSHPSTNTFVNTTKWNSKKKVILPPKKYNLFSILDSSWLFQTEEFNVCTLCTIRTHAITTNRTHCCLLLSWGRARAAVAQCGCCRLNPYCGVCYTSVAHVVAIIITHKMVFAQLEELITPWSWWWVHNDTGTPTELNPPGYPRGAPHPHALKQDAHQARLPVIWRAPC